MAVTPERTVANAFLREMGGFAGAPQNVVDLVNAQRSIRAEQNPLLVAAGAKAPPRDALLALAQANIGVDYAPGTRNKVLTPLETARLTRANQWVDILSNISEGNVAALAGSAPTRAAIENVISSNPVVDAQYRAMGINQTAVRTSMLSDRRVREYVNQKLIEYGAPTQLLTNEISAKERELSNLIAERPRFVGEEARLAGLLTQKRNEYAQYDYVAPGPPPVPGRFMAQMIALERTAEPLRKDVTKLEKRADNLEASIKKSEDAKADWLSKLPTTVQTNQGGGSNNTVTALTDLATPALAARVTQFDNDINALRNELNMQVRPALVNANRDLKEAEQELKFLQDKKESLAKEVGANGDESIQKQLEAARGDLTEHLKKISDKDEEIKRDKAERTQKEEEFVGKLSNVLPEAIATLINERMGAYIEEQKKAEDKQKEAASSQLERDIREVMNRIGRTATGQMDWVDFRNAWALFRRQGPDALLRARIPVVPPPGRDIYRELQGNTTLRDKINDDLKTKMARYRLSMPRQRNVVLRRMFGGGPEAIDQAEAIDLMNNLGNDYIDKVVASKKDIRAELDKLAKEGTLKWGTGNLAEGLGKLPLLPLLLILSLVVGGPLLLGGTVGLGTAAKGLGAGAAWLAR